MDENFKKPAPPRDWSIYIVGGASILDRQIGDEVRWLAGLEKFFPPMGGGPLVGFQLIGQRCREVLFWL